MDSNQCAIYPTRLLTTGCITTAHGPGLEATPYLITAACQWPCRVSTLRELSRPLLVYFYPHVRDQVNLHINLNVPFEIDDMGVFTTMRLHIARCSIFSARYQLQLSLCITIRRCNQRFCLWTLSLSVFACRKAILFYFEHLETRI